MTIWKEVFCLDLLEICRTLSILHGVKLRDKCHDDLERNVLSRSFWNPRITNLGPAYLRFSKADCRARVDHKLAKRCRMYR